MEPAAKILVVDDNKQNLWALRRTVTNDYETTLSIPGSLPPLTARRMPLPSLHAGPHWFPGRVAPAACLMQQKGAFKILIRGGAGIHPRLYALVPQCPAWVCQALMELKWLTTEIVLAIHEEPSNIF